MNTALILAALLILRPHSPARSCIDARHDEIVSMATRSAETFDVPVALLLVVGFSETHFGCDPASGGNWGAPRDRNHRQTAGTSDSAASALALGYRECRTWLGAVSHFRCGRCGTCPAGQPGYTARGALRRVRQLNRLVARSVSGS